MQNKCTVNIFASLQVFIGLAPDLSDKAAFILFHPLSEYLDNKIVQNVYMTDRIKSTLSRLEKKIGTPKTFTGVISENNSSEGEK